MKFISQKRGNLRETVYALRDVGYDSRGLRRAYIEDYNSRSCKLLFGAPIISTLGVAAAIATGFISSYYLENTTVAPLLSFIPAGVAIRALSTHLDSLKHDFGSLDQILKTAEMNRKHMEKCRVPGDYPESLIEYGLDKV